MLLIIVIFMLLLFILTFSYIAYRMAFYTPKRPEGDLCTLPPGMTKENMGPDIAKCMKEMMERPCEEVSITSFDSKKLFARYYHVQDHAPVQIMFHGYKSTPFVDMSGGSKLAGKLGQNALVVDQRSHGKSEGNTITFGIKERKDCLCWIKYVLERFGQDTPILLVGLSMGAATVLMAADLDLPANVKGIIADCPYSTPKDIILKTCKDMHFPPKLTYPFVRLGAFLYGHFNLEESSAVLSVQKAKVPILLIHGESDSFVPCHMSHEIQKACASPVTLVTVPGAGHGRSYLVNPKLYEDAILRFTNQILN